MRLSLLRNYIYLVIYLISSVCICRVESCKYIYIFKMHEKVSPNFGLVVYGQINLLGVSHF